MSGTLTVGKVISSGSTALAVAAEPAFGNAGYWLMSVTALFATAGATMRSRSWPPAGPPDFVFTTLLHEPASMVTLGRFSC